VFTHEFCDLCKIKDSKISSYLRNKENKNSYKIPISATTLDKVVGDKDENSFKRFGINNVSIKHEIRQ